LKLGAGFGGAIAVRGGPQIQKDLDKLAPVGPYQAVISNAGELKAKYIIHANGPKFQEEDMEGKIKTTIINSLKLADEKGIKKIAFPPMGTGFYGVPLDRSARITLHTLKEYLQGNTGIEEVFVCLNDNREFTGESYGLSSFRGTPPSGNRPAIYGYRVYSAPPMATKIQSRP
jgi:O-acetyl-ADP-ribose deacetylase (regulator of RNase III)